LILFEFNPYANFGLVLGAHSLDPPPSSADDPLALFALTIFEEVVKSSSVAASKKVNKFKILELKFYPKTRKSGK
jgi:hypothetical protein